MNVGFTLSKYKNIFTEIIKVFYSPLDLFCGMTICVLYEHVYIPLLFYNCGLQKEFLDI